MAVLSCGCGAARCPTSSEAFDHCGESGTWGEEELWRRVLCQGLGNGVDSASALKPVGSVAWPRVLSPQGLAAQY